MAAEKKARAEVEELRNQIKKNLDNERKERRKLADEEALKKIKALEDQLQSLQKQLASQKQVSYQSVYLEYIFIYHKLAVNRVQQCLLWFIRVFASLSILLINFQSEQ